MKTVCETLGVARSNIAARAAGSPSRARGRLPLPDRELVEEIKAVIADTPTYGYRRVHAILRRNARKLGERLARTMIFFCCARNPVRVGKFNQVKAAQEEQALDSDESQARRRPSSVERLS